jgi:hypothetical protein
MCDCAMVVQVVLTAVQALPGHKALAAGYSYKSKGSSSSSSSKIEHMFTVELPLAQTVKAHKVSTVLTLTTAFLQAIAPSSQVHTASDCALHKQ